MNSSIVSNITGTLTPNQKVSNHLQSSLLMPMNFTKTEVKTNSTHSNNQLKVFPKSGVRSSSNLSFNGQVKANNNNFDQNRNPQAKQSKLVNGNKNCIDNGEDVMPVPKQMLFNGKISVEWHQAHKIGAGLSNLGNSCFMNTVLQCLTYCPPLANYLLYDDHALKCKLSGFCMMCELQHHIKRVILRPGQVVKPNHIYSKLPCIAKSFKLGRQEDAHEFLRYLIEKLWKSCLSTHEGYTKLDPASKETTAINKIFGGYHRSQVTCVRCKEKSNTYDHFMDLMLDVKQNVVTLEKALDKFIQPELLQFENAYKCPHCKMKVSAQKKFTIFKAPNVATFQFKRFDFHNRTFEGKITKLITYPESLNLRPYMSTPKGSPIMYRLNAVLVHLGSTCNSGHYFCYVRNSNGYWYLMDDSRVQQVSLNVVLNQNAYVLFYIKTNSSEIKRTSQKPFENSSGNIKNNYITKNGFIGPVNCTTSPSSISHLPLNEKSNSLPGISKLSVSPMPNGLQNGTLTKVISKPQIQPFTLQKKRKGTFTADTNGVNINGIRTNSVVPNGKKNLLPAVKKASKSSSLVPYVEGSSEDETSEMSKNTSKENSGKLEMPFSPFKKMQAICSNDSKGEMTLKKPLSSATNKSSAHSDKRNETKKPFVSQEKVPSKAEITTELDAPVKTSYSVANVNEFMKNLVSTSTPKINASSSWNVTEVTHTMSVASGSSTNSVNSSTEWNIEPDFKRKEEKTISPLLSVLDVKSNNGKNAPLAKIDMVSSPRDGPKSSIPKLVHNLSSGSLKGKLESPSAKVKPDVNKDVTNASSINNNNSSGVKLSKIVNGMGREEIKSPKERTSETKEPNLNSKEPVPPFRNQSFRKFDTVSSPRFKSKKEISPQNSDSSDSEVNCPKRTTKSFDTGEDCHGTLPKRLKTDTEASTKNAKKHSAISNSVRKEDNASDVSSVKSTKSSSSFQTWLSRSLPINKHSHNLSQSERGSPPIQKVANRSFQGEKTRRHIESSSSSSEDEVTWVEKTKESMEKEAKFRGNSWSQFSGNKSESNKIPSRKDIVTELQRDSDSLFGRSVGSWNNSDARNRNLSTVRRPWQDLDDLDYDDELDRGKVRHRKKDSYHRNDYKYNPFQAFENSRNNGDNRYENFRPMKTYHQPYRYQDRYYRNSNRHFSSNKFRRPHNHHRR